MHAEFRGRSLQEPVVVRVLETGLQHVVIDVRDRQLVAHPIDAQRLELQEREGPRGVLGQGVIDPDGDLRPRNELTFYEVLGKDPFSYGTSHG